tara:strand:- start:353 stop:877 length:525 start_codon:yes stop_codon:yes gene_type:complete
MSIRINIVDPDAIKIALEARKTLDGNIMILDHLHMDIIINPSRNLVVTYPKENLNEDAYATQNAYFGKLASDGVILRDSVQAGNVFGSIQALYPKEGTGDTNPLHVILLSTKNFIKEELGYLQMEKDYEDEVDEEYLDPTAEDSTELGEVPEEPKKGSITPYYVRNYLSGYFMY